MRGGDEMGSWGPKLYQDDIAQDVRDTYKDRLRRGKTTKEITEEYRGEIQDIDDGPIFWFALADIQWDWWPGHIVPIVKVKVTDDEALPTEEEFYNLQYIKMSFEGESIYNGEKLFNYGLMLLNTSKIIIPKDLKYIGNYKECPSINNEYIITQDISYLSYIWGYIEKHNGQLYVCMVVKLVLLI